MALSTDHTDIPLAIIGMACRLPEAENLEQYWRLIVEGRSAIAEVPAERFDQQLYFDPAKGVRGKSYSKLAALLGSREFDSERNPIDEQLRRSVDLMHLLMTGVAADALRHAGMDPFALRTRNTAVFIGNGGSSDACARPITRPTWSKPFACSTGSKALPTSIPKSERPSLMSASPGSSSPPCRREPTRGCCSAT